MMGSRCGVKIELDRCLAAALKLLDRLGMMAMPGHAVRLEVVRRLGEEKAHLRLASRAGGARLAIGDEMPAVDDAGLEQRHEAELHRGRIAPGVADDARLPDFFAMEFGQAVHRFLEEIGTRVLQLVPLLEHRDVADAEVRREVDDLHAGADELARLRHGHAVGRCEEHDVARLEVRGVGRGEHELVVLAAQAREHVDHARAGFAARRDGAHVGVRVRREDPEKLDTRVAGAADDADLDHCVTSYRGLQS